MNFLEAQAGNRQRTVWLVGILTAILVLVAWAFNAWVTGEVQSFMGGPVEGKFKSRCSTGTGFLSSDYADQALSQSLGGDCTPIPAGETRVPFLLTPAGTAAGALCFSAFIAAFSYYYGDRATLYVSGARPVNPKDPKEKQFINVAEEMAIAAGLPLPTLWILPDPDLNAFATGRDPSRSAIAVTEGLLGSLNRDELQAVVAHEMGHIRNRDTLLLLFVTCMLGAILLITELMMRGTRYRRWGFRNKESGAAILIIFLAAVLSWILGRFVARVAAMAVSREREYLADATSAELTRNPMSLASALGKIRLAIQPTAVAHPATAPLFIDDPRGHSLNEKESKFASLMSTHPPIDTRIQRLQAMAFANLKRERRASGLDPLTGNPLANG